MSLFNVLEDVRIIPQGTTVTPVVTIGSLVAVSCWNREPGDENQDFQTILRVQIPGQDSKDFPMNFEMKHPRHRQSFRFQGLPHVEPGELRFDLLLNGRHIASHTVNVFPPAAADVDVGATPNSGPS